MSNINLMHIPSGLSGTSQLGFTSDLSSLSQVQVAFQSTLKNLQATTLRSRLVLQRSSAEGTSNKGSSASTELLNMHIARDCGYLPA